MHPMSPIKIIMLLVASIVLFGCGRGTDTGKVFVPEAGHPAAWASHLAVGTKDFHGTAMTSVSADSVGPRLFVLHCAPCHGIDGSGKIGPNIQAATLPLIVSAIQNLSVMRGHAGLANDELQSIAGYVATLAGSAPLASASYEPELCRQCHGTGLDGGIATVSCFACHNGPDGSLGHPVGWSSAKQNPISFHGSYGRKYSSGCTTCHGADLNGGFVFLSSNPGKIAPRCANCHDGAIAPSLTLALTN
jgi:mono/diheme cytochrome c family protein